MKRLEGRVAIVTGGGQGIGRGIAFALAREGAAICLAEINPESGPATARELEKLGVRAIAAHCDVRKRDEVDAAVATTLSELGGIDILVNNATGASGEAVPYKPLLAHSDEDWNRKIDTDLKGSFHFMMACHPHLKARRGTIINLCSAAGSERGEGFAAYAACKEALRALTGVAAKEWGPDGVRVNALCPIAMTPGLKGHLEAHPEIAAEALSKIPLGRYGDPERDIGRVALFLASSDSDYITGQTLWVDGGQVIHA